MLNVRTKEQVIREHNASGIVIIFKDKTGITQEEISQGTLEKFIMKNNLSWTTGFDDIAKLMIEKFNSNLKENESRRTIIHMFLVYQSKTFIKIKND